ncbi:hypothetical protein L6R52_21485 [Myxococcota bacterium]|nr:hypothetical protein [Myxococcota bacterium]
MKTRILGCAAFTYALTVSASAFAQSPTYGFPIGEKSRIHTNLDLGVGYDSNPDRRTTNISDWRALIRPGLDVNVPGSGLALDLGAHLAISQFFGVDQPSDTTFGGSVAAKLRLGRREAPVGFQLENTLVRTPDYLDESGTIAADERLYKQWNNQGKAVLALRPGGGALSFDVGYTNTMSFYDDNAQGQPLLPWSQRHGAMFDAKLRFLPKTAAVFHADFSFFSVDEEVGASKESTPYNVTLGLVGQVTPRISTHLAVGFGDTLTWDDGFFSATDASNKRTLIATVEGTYDFTEASRLTIGYRRQVQPVIVLSNFRRDALFAQAQVAIGARLLTKLMAQYEFRNYGEGDRDAQLLTGDARIEYWFFEFLQAALNYRLIRQSTDAPDPLLLQEYTRHEAFMFVGLRY